MSPRVICIECGEVTDPARVDDFRAAMFSHACSPRDIPAKCHYRDLQAEVDRLTRINQDWEHLARQNNWAFKPDDERDALITHNILLIEACRFVVHNADRLIEEHGAAVPEWLHEWRRRCQCALDYTHGKRQSAPERGVE